MITKIKESRQNWKVLFIAFWIAISIFIAIVSVLVQFYQKKDVINYSYYIYVLRNQHDVNQAIITEDIKYSKDVVDYYLGEGKVGIGINTYHIPLNNKIKILDTLDNDVVKFKAVCYIY